MEIDIAYKKLKLGEISPDDFHKALKLYVSQRLPKNNSFGADSIEATLQIILTGIKNLENEPDFSELDITSYVTSHINTAILKPFSQRYRTRLKI